MIAENEYDIYLYGMVLMTTSHLLATPFPKPDSYTEFTKRYRLAGGETGTCAAVLASLGAKVKLDGNHLGTTTYPPLKEYFDEVGVDMELMTFDEDYEGLEDYVFIDKDTRTSFGCFESYFAADQPKRWNIPSKSDLVNVKAVGLDPFFFEQSEMVAGFCNELGIKYATIDCRYDSIFHQLSEVNVLSSEFLKGEYESIDYDDLFKKYANASSGMVIFTFGSKELWYGRSGEGRKSFKPYKVEIESTLGAGDSFKAGVIYALSKNMTDIEIVSFASATAASACMHFPIQLDPPTLKRVFKIQHI